MPTPRQRQPTRPQWWRHQWPAWPPRRPTRPSGASPPLRPDVQAPRPLQPSELQPRAAGCCRKKQSAATNRASTGSTTAATRHGDPSVGWGRSTQTRDAKGWTQRERRWWQRRRREWPAKEQGRQQQRQREDVGRAMGSSWTPQTQKRPSVARAWRRRGGRTFHKLMRTPYAGRSTATAQRRDCKRRTETNREEDGVEHTVSVVVAPHRIRGGARARRSWTERGARRTGGERGVAPARTERGQNGRERRHSWAAMAGAPQFAEGRTRRAWALLATERGPPSRARGIREILAPQRLGHIQVAPAARSAGGALRLGSPAARGGERTQTAGHKRRALARGNVPSEMRSGAPSRAPDWAAAIMAVMITLWGRAPALVARCAPPPRPAICEVVNRADGWLASASCGRSDENKYSLTWHHRNFYFSRRTCERLSASGTWHVWQFATFRPLDDQTGLGRERGVTATRAYTSAQSQLHRRRGVLRRTFRLWWPSITPTGTCSAPSCFMMPRVRETGDKIPRVKK